MTPEKIILERLLNGENPIHTNPELFDDVTKQTT